MRTILTAPKCAWITRVGMYSDSVMIFATLLHSWRQLMQHFAAHRHNNISQSCLSNRQTDLTKQIYMFPLLSDSRENRRGYRRLLDASTKENTYNDDQSHLSGAWRLLCVTHMGGYTRLSHAHRLHVQCGHYGAVYRRSGALIGDVTDAPASVPGLAWHMWRLRNGVQCSRCHPDDDRSLLGGSVLVLSVP